MIQNAQFFGTKHTKTRKTHTCFGTGKTIQPGTITRQDVWKEWSKMVSKYYCQDVEYLFDTQYTLRLYGQPFNPMKWQIWQMFPHYFDDYFAIKYPKEKRIIILADLREFVERFGWPNIAQFAFSLVKIFGKHSFDKNDVVRFCKLYDHTKKYWHFITKDSR